MNCSKTNETLRNISTSLSNDIYLGVTESKLILDDVNTELTSITTNTSNANTNLININTNLASIKGYNDTMNTTLISLNSTNSTISGNITSTNSILATLLGLTSTGNTSLSNIDTELSKTKIIFNARLTDGTNEYLQKADYFSSPIDFYWQNDKGVPVYVTKYRYIYAQSAEPTIGELYHSTTFDSNIGAMNSDGDDYEAPYITVKSNLDYYGAIQPNLNKQTWTSNAGWCFEKDFSYAPIEIGVSRKFGHHIAHNINIAEYDSDPIGIVEGYYYSS